MATTVTITVGEPAPRSRTAPSSTPPTTSPTTIGDDCVVGHNAHLEGCSVEDKSLIGSGSVVLHRAVVRTGGLVGAGAVVPNDLEVPSAAMALGIPAKIKLDAVPPGVIQIAVDLYVENAARYKTDLRRLD